jgi:hypothetical protein
MSFGNTIRPFSSNAFGRFCVNELNLFQFATGRVIHAAFPAIEASCLFVPCGRRVARLQTGRARDITNFRQYLDSSVRLLLQPASSVR